MPANTTVGIKVCRACGRDVSQSPRMKDHRGQYWCIACGKADELKQRDSAGGLCFDCGDSFTKPQLMELGGHRYCKTCLKKRYSHSHGHAPAKHDGNLGATPSRGVLGGLLSRLGLKRA